MGSKVIFRRDSTTNTLGTEHYFQRDAGSNERMAINNYICQVIPSSLTHSSTQK